MKVYTSIYWYILVFIHIVQDIEVYTSIYMYILVYRTAHPALRWLPTKLAEWIGENLQEELGFPDFWYARSQLFFTCVLQSKGCCVTVCHDIYQDIPVHNSVFPDA